VELHLHSPHSSSWCDSSLIRYRENFTFIYEYYVMYIYTLPIAVAALSKALTVFPDSNAGIVVSNPTQGIDILCVGRGLETG
jgi:hypothetical protein